jgi:hypothetical protein
VLSPHGKKELQDFINKLSRDSRDLWPRTNNGKLMEISLPGGAFDRGMLVADGKTMKLVPPI